MKIRNALIVSTILISLCNGKAMAATSNTVSEKNSSALATTTTSDSDIKMIQEKYDVATDKKWTIKFNKQLNSQDFKKGNIAVLDSNGQAVAVTVLLNSDNMSVDVLPPSSKYINGQTYTINVNKSILSKDNFTLPKAVRMNFTIVKISSGSSGNTNPSNTNVDPSLIEAKNGLVKVKDIVKTQSEKDLVTALESAIDAKINDSSVVVDTTVIKSKYNGLSASDSADFKSVMLANLSISTLLKVRTLLQ